VDVSPDGTRIVYVANNQLYLRNLNEVDARPIQGTDVDPSSPVFSPDGQWVAFWSADQLKKIPITGGTPVVLCRAENPFGASWSIDNWVWFADTAGIKRVSGNAGESELLVETGQGEQAHGPALLPDGQTLLFTLTSASGNNRWDQAEIVVQPLNGGDRKVLWKGGADARYVPSGHIVYALESTLLAMPFDLARLEPTGGPVPVVEDAQRALSPGTNTGSAHYAVSRTGSLVYVAGSDAALIERSLVRVDAAGTATSLADERRDYADPQVSPDGRQLAVTVTDPVGGVHIWIVDLESGVGSQLTFEGSNRRAAWTPDGERLVFQSDRDGAPRLFWQVADGSRPAEALPETKEPPFPGNVSRDGVLAFYTIARGGHRDLFTRSLDSGAESAFLTTPANERTPAFSPDGRWLAYASTESGRDEVFLRPYPPSGGGQYRVSEGGGVSPQWSPKGDTLYYVSPSGNLMAVPIQTAPVFRRGRPREMFPVSNRFRIVPNNRDYDVHPRDGSFVFVSLVGGLEGGTATVRQEINIVLNWFEELRQRVR
jgi:serine/threonine-protein kinase